MTDSDPFECRLTFLSLLEKLNASQQSIHKVATYAVRHRQLSEDLYSCLLEELEQVITRLAILSLFLGLPSFLFPLSFCKPGKDNDIASKTSRHASSLSVFCACPSVLHETHSRSWLLHLLIHKTRPKTLFLSFYSIWREGHKL